LVLSYHQSDLERRDMAQHRRSSLALSGEHARQALAILVQEGKLRAGDVMKALQRRERLIRALQASLAALETGAVSVGKRLLGNRAPRKARKATTVSGKVARRKPRISAATRKIYQQQGRYMAALRNLSKAARAKVKKIREKSGVQAAIVAAKKMAG
jgi:hypothetical protein